MLVPEFNSFYPTKDEMNRKQYSFYKKLESSLNNSDYLDVDGNISYIFTYLYEIILKWNRNGYENLSENLIYISELYKADEKLSDYCLHWSYDCLLGLKKYEDYLEKTEPKEPFGTSTHISDLRLLIQKKIGIEANPIDLLLLAGGRRSKFIVNHQGKYKDKITEIFTDYSEDNGGWFNILEKGLKTEFIQNPIQYEYECKEKYKDKFREMFFKYSERNKTGWVEIFQKELKNEFKNNPVQYEDKDNFREALLGFLDGKSEWFEIFKDEMKMDFLNHPKQYHYKEKFEEALINYSEGKEEWFEMFDRWMTDHSLYIYGPDNLFLGVPSFDEDALPSLEFQNACFYSASEVMDEINILSREAENQAREEVGLPKIGEGWISETELFKKLESIFYKTKVIQHGRPTWLGRQHFDIWIPNWKIAVEYHGRQHFEPVEFFGGQEAFEKSVERDERKASLSKKNGVALFIITEDDDQDELIQNINESIRKRKVMLIE